MYVWKWTASILARWQLAASCSIRTYWLCIRTNHTLTFGMDWRLEQTFSCRSKDSFNKQYK